MLPLPAHACALVSRQGGLWWAQSSLGREGDEGFLPPCCQQPPVQCRGAHGMGGDVWKVQAEEKSLGREGRREIAPCIQSSGEQAGCATTLLPKANLKVTDFPLIFEKVKNSFFLTYYYLLPITAGVLRGSSWNQVLPMPGTAQPWGYKQPLPGFAALQDQTDPINISPAFQVGSCYIEGFQQELGNVSEVWLSSFLGLRSRIKLYLLLL